MFSLYASRFSMHAGGRGMGRLHRRIAGRRQQPRGVRRNFSGQGVSQKIIRVGNVRNYFQKFKKSVPHRTALGHGPQLPTSHRISKDTCMYSEPEYRGTPLQRIFLGRIWPRTIVQIVLGESRFTEFLILRTDFDGCNVFVVRRFHFTRNYCNLTPELSRTSRSSPVMCSFVAYSDSTEAQNSLEHVIERNDEDLIAESNNDRLCPSNKYAGPSEVLQELTAWMGAKTIHILRSASS